VVIDGAFPDATNWNDTGWTIGSGVADHDTGNTSALNQDMTITGGVSRDDLDRVRTMLTVFTTASRTAGTVGMIWSGSNPKDFKGTLRSTNATFTELIRWPDGAVSGSTGFAFLPTTDFDGSVDNVKIYPDGAHESPGGHDLQIASGATQIITPSWGLRTERIGVWCPTSGVEENIGIWGMHVPANRV